MTQQRKQKKPYKCYIDINSNEKSLIWERAINERTWFKKNKKGEKIQYWGYETVFPKSLQDFIGAENNIYFYEHFEKICITSETPPENIKFKKLSLKKTIPKSSKYKETLEKKSNRKISVPKKYWELKDNYVLKITLCPKKDYIFPENPLITVEVIEKDIITETSYDSELKLINQVCSQIK